MKQFVFACQLILLGILMIICMLIAVVEIAVGVLLIVVLPEKGDYDGL